MNKLKIERTHGNWETILCELRRILPLQNPLVSFVHNNMLMAWEPFEFWDGVARASELYQARPFESIRLYWDKRQKNEIFGPMLRQGIADCLVYGDQWVGRSVGSDPVVELLALLFEASPTIPGVALGNIVADKTAELTDRLAFRGEPEISTVSAPLFDLPTIDWICHLLEGALDQGVAHWYHPSQEQGLLSFFYDWIKYTPVYTYPWQRAVATSAAGSRKNARTIILEHWEASKQDAGSWQRTCLRLLFQAKGWAGMLNKAEMEAKSMPFNQPQARVEDFLAILLLLTDAHGIDLGKLGRPLIDPRLEATFPSLDRKTLVKIQRHFGIAQPDLLESPEAVRRLVDALQIFDRPTTIKAWHIAAEASIYASAIRSISLPKISNAEMKGARNIKKSFQVLCCLDDREESIRRHLEAEDPACETFGVLGNFGLDMRFVSANHPTPKQHCPPVITPRRVLVERSLNLRNRFKSVRQSFAAKHFHGSRSLVAGAVSSLAIGPIALVNLALHSTVPKMGWRFHKRLDRTFFPDKLGVISLRRRTDPKYGECGYSVEEQVEMVASILEAAPLHGVEMTDLIIVMGHESTSVNNPFEQTYGCGACSGNSGAANARIFAKMANNLEVRSILAARGLVIEPRVFFLAAAHNTATDIVRYFGADEGLNSESLTESFALADKAINRALLNNARERCEFFINVDRGSSKPARYLSHVRNRAIDLSEVRPEYGHSRTCFAVFGRRNLTSEISLDRRAFLVSYDSTKDESGKVLEGLIHGALPVVANITLDYFFSAADPQGFGAGSKLPLNVAGLVGVISGSRGDLRIGLAEQMVELHEAIRGFALIEATKEAIEACIFSHKRLTNLVKNGWLRIGSIDPDTKDIAVWTNDGWKAPSIDSALMIPEIAAFGKGTMAC